MRMPSRAFGTESDGLQSASISIAYGILTLIVLLPMFVLDHPPLLDYPNHVARLHILLSLGDDEHIQKFYESNWTFFPNLGVEILGLVPAYLFGAEVAGRLLTYSIILLTTSGAVILSFVLHGRLTPASLVVLLFTYNQIFLLGFMSYLLGLGLWLWSMAFWASRGERLSARDVTIASILATLLMSFHLFAFGLYAVCVATIELKKAILSARIVNWMSLLARLFWSAAQFAPGLILLLKSTTGSNLANAQSETWKSKLFTLSYIIDVYHPPTQLVLVCLLVLVVAVAVIRKWLIIAPVMVAPLTALVAVFIVLPASAGSAFVSARMPIAIAFLLASSLASSPSLGKRAEGILIIAISLAVIAHSAYIARTWWQYRPLYGDIDSAIAQLERGSLVRLVAGRCGSYHRLMLEPPVDEILGFAIIRRSIFMTALFASNSAQPVSYRSEYRGLVKEHTWSGEVCNYTGKESRQEAWRKVIQPGRFAAFDYVMTIEATDVGLEFFPEFKEVFSRGEIRLFQRTR